VQLHAEEPDRSGYVRYVSRRYGNLVDAFSVTSEQLKRVVTGYDIPPSKVEVIYSGVDAELEFNPDRVEPLALPGNGSPRILWPGRLVEQKDPLLTLEVLLRVRERGADFVLDVVGDGDLAPAVRARAAALGVADAIEWHPPSHEMAPWYRSADLLLMTSLFEGVPYVMYEALAMGVPIVAPALPGNLEFMDADSGALVEPRDDVDQYADAVVALLADTDRRRSMGRRSRERMRAEFSLTRMGRDHDALYERLLDARDRELAPLTEVEALSAHDRVQQARPAPPRPSTLFVRNPPPPRTVGIVIPCYRHGIYLDDCIASVKAQTLAPAAIVVVDDGSDDPETRAALALLDDDPDVTVLRQDRRRGPSAARNRALAELDTSYVLPLDADDLLLPDALEQMVAQLEAAPPDVGFVYPNAEHTGNRSDYIASPAYNLWLLMADNYCPAPALFDRRAFDAGASYPEDMVLGHEDWDLFLQLGEQGIRGEHTRARTFLYRKYGFSRITAVENGRHDAGDPIDQRHPGLYRNRDAIKARWSPAVSIVLADEGDDTWRPGDLDGRPEQTCRDYEVVAAREMVEQVRLAEAAEEDSPAARLQACMSAARGRWVCVLTPRARAAIADRSLVERLIHCFWDHERTSGVVLAEAPELGRAAFSQLDDEERLEAWPVGVAIERVAEQPTPPVELGVTDGLLTDLVVNVQAHGPLQWRLAPRLGARGAPSANRDATSSNGHRAAPTNGHVRPSSENGNVAHREAAGRPTRRPATAGVLTLDREPPADSAEAWVQRAVSWQEPLLPGCEPGTPRRWDAAASWVPPETLRLCRHRAIGGDRWIVTTSRQSPAGYSLAYDLGVVHRHAFPGTRRLVAGDGTFALTDEQGDLGDGRVGLGYVEQMPLPMLDVLELRRDPETGAEVLVAGPHDPLFDRAEPLATLGWIEPFPLNPRRTELHLGPWGAIALRRYVDRDAWRHGYRTGAVGEEADAVALGSVLRQPGETLVELRLLRDGRVESDLTRPSRPSADPMRAARWMLAPLTWGSIPPPAWAQRATASRARHLARRRGRPKLRRADRDRTLGWLRRAPADGYSALFSATHPVTGDQFLTRSRIEATDLGYRIDGVLGYLFNAGADAPATLNATDVLWGSRFGRGRRYAEA
jgi:hypothetical protein